MFDLSKLIIAEPCLSNGGKLIILSATPKKQYLDGKYTDVIEGYKVDVCAISNDFENFQSLCQKNPTFLKICTEKLLFNLLTLKERYTKTSKATNMI